LISKSKLAQPGLSDKRGHGDTTTAVPLRLLTEAMPKWELHAWQATILQRHALRTLAL